MGLLAYVGGVLTSFGGTTTEIATKDTDTQDLLEQILIELKVSSMVIKLGLEVDVDLDELRNDVTEG